MARIVLDPSRTTWTCYCQSDAPPGVSQCPTCGGVTFNHVEFRKAWVARILGRAKRRR